MGGVIEIYREVDFRTSRGPYGYGGNANRAEAILGWWRRKVRLRSLGFRAFLPGVLYRGDKIEYIMRCIPKYPG